MRKRWWYGPSRTGCRRLCSLLRRRWTVASIRAGTEGFLGLLAAAAAAARSLADLMLLPLEESRLMI